MWVFLDQVSNPCLLYWQEDSLQLSHQASPILSLWSLPSPALPPTPKMVTKPKTGLLVLYSSFPQAIYFTHGSTYTSILFSQFVPPSPFPAVSPCLFFMPASLFLPSK